MIEFTLLDPATDFMRPRRNQCWLEPFDPRRVDANWRTGGWQGYQYTDFEATVDLGRERPVHRLGASFLQDVRSWIWMPREVVVSASSDGVDFRWVARVTDDGAFLFVDEILID